MRFLGCLVLLTIPTLASAQATPLTLAEAISQGLANSRRLAEIEARAEAADFAIAGRQSADGPQIALQGGYLRTNHVPEFSITFPLRAPQVVYPDIPNNYRTRLDLQWPIYTGGRTGALEEASRAERGAIGKDLEAARADLQLEITRAFWAVVTARETATVIKTSVEVALAHVRDVRARLASGLVPPNDVSSAEAQSSHQRLLAIEASTQLAIAEADLRRLTGNDTATAVASLTIENAPPPIPPAVVTPDVIAAALKARPERQAMEARAESAGLRASAVSAGGRPQVVLGSGFDYARPNPRIFPRSGEWQTSWDVGLNVSWTLWDGGRRSAEHGEAVASATALKHRVEDFDRQVTFEVRARSLELNATLEAVTTANDGIRAAAETERVVNERYQAGVATNSDVLDAQSALLQANLDLTRALANVRLAHARLERALGR